MMRLTLPEPSPATAAYLPEAVPFGLRGTHHLLSLGPLDLRTTAEFFVENHHPSEPAAVNFLCVFHDARVARFDCPSDEWLEPGEIKSFRLTAREELVLEPTTPRSGRSFVRKNKDFYTSLRFHVGLSKNHVPDYGLRFLVDSLNFAAVHAAVRLPRGTSGLYGMHYSVVAVPLTPPPRLSLAEVNQRDVLGLDDFDADNALLGE
jgi:hypothetical protein